MAETISIKDVYREVVAIKQGMVSRKELESFFETMEVLHNADTVRRLKAAERDIREGKVKRVRNVKDLLADMP